MRTLNILVNNKVATYLQRDGNIVCGNSDYQIVFTFDSDWSNHENKTARFIWNGTYYDQEFTGTTCAVPIINDASLVTVGVYAGTLFTTTPAEILCDKSILCGTNTANDGAVKEYRDEAQISAQNAKASEEEAKRAEQNVKLALENLKNSSEEWEFILEDGSTVTKAVCVL